MEHKVVGPEAWFEASAAFLKKEKEFTRLRDSLAAERRAQPWTLVEKKYVFETLEGPKSLGELFGKKSQLFIQHFMFGPDWKEGCPGCSFQADHIQGALAHLAQRDVHFVAISRASVAQLEAFRRRMGWSFEWVSSLNNDFNFDFGVSFTEKDKAANKIFYNFETTSYQGDELPGNSAFYKNEKGEIFRTYSSYARGCEMFMSTYMLLDLLPKGRDEIPFKDHPMEWVKHHDKYDTSSTTSCCH